jgi:acyl carrier protein
MQDDGSELPRARLVKLVEEILAKTSMSGPVCAEAELTAVGLTSIDMIHLMLGIEAEFDMMIPASEITPANFRSIASIEAMIARIIAGGAAK